MLSDQFLQLFELGLLFLAQLINFISQYGCFDQILYIIFFWDKLSNRPLEFDQTRRQFERNFPGVHFLHLNLHKVLDIARHVILFVD